MLHNLLTLKEEISGLSTRKHYHTWCTLTHNRTQNHTSRAVQRLRDLDMKTPDPNHTDLLDRAASCRFSSSRSPQPESRRHGKSFNLHMCTSTLCVYVIIKCRVISFGLNVLWFCTHLYYERSRDRIDATSVWYAHNLIVTWRVGCHSLSGHSHIHNSYKDHKPCEDGLPPCSVFVEMVSGRLYCVVTMKTEVCGAAQCGTINSSERNIKSNMTHYRKDFLDCMSSASFKSLIKSFICLHRQNDCVCINIRKPEAKFELQFYF